MKGQTSVEFLLLLAALLVTLAGILTYFVTSSSSMGSSVSGDVENLRQEAVDLLKSDSAAPSYSCGPTFSITAPILEPLSPRKGLSTLTLTFWPFLTLKGASAR